MRTKLDPDQDKLNLKKLEANTSADWWKEEGKKEWMFDVSSHVERKNAALLSPPMADRPVIRQQLLFTPILLTHSFKSTIKLS